MVVDLLALVTSSAGGAVLTRVVGHVLDGRRAAAARAERDAAAAAEVQKAEIGDDAAVRELLAKQLSAVYERLDEERDACDKRIRALEERADAADLAALQAADNVAKAEARAVAAERKAAEADKRAARIAREFHEFREHATR